MQEEQTFYPVTTEYFTACLPLLEKYFGITAGYFNKELSDAKCLIPHREGNNVKYGIKEDCNLVLPFRHLECHDLLSLINSYGTITPIIEEALLLVAYCIRERQIDENEYNDLIQFHTWDIYQSEWAHLLLFMEQMEARAFQGNEQTAITIRTNNGIKEKISIPNSDNWLFRLIKKELAGYFPEVQTAEKARQDIQWRKPSAGRKRIMPSIRQLHTAFTECSMKKTQYPASPICRTNYAHLFTTLHGRWVAIPIIKGGMGPIVPIESVPILPPI